MQGRYPTSLSKRFSMPDQEDGGDVEPMNDNKR